MMIDQNDLKHLRERITALDHKLLALLSERRAISLDVVKTKINSHLPVRDTQREKILLKQLIEQGGTYHLDSQYIIRLYQLIIEDSVLLQQNFLQQYINHDNTNHDHTKAAKIAFLGPKGSYSHLATRRYAATHFDNLVECGCKNFADVVEQAENGYVDLAVLPIENTSSGSITDVYDLLQHTQLFIVGELNLPIDHCILVKDPSLTLAEIETVYTHPQPFQQSSHFMAKYPQWQIQFCDSSSSAMKKVSQLDDPKAAAISNKDGGDLYGLHALVNNFANQATNITRFIVLARKNITVSPQIPAKITLLIATKQHAGALVDALLILRQHNIVMTKLESRPIYGNPWEEMFYIDISANLDDAQVQTMLKALTNTVNFIKVLGCYPSDTISPVDIAG